MHISSGEIPTEVLCPLLNGLLLLSYQIHATPLHGLPPDFQAALMTKPTQPRGRKNRLQNQELVGRVPSPQCGLKQNVSDLGRDDARLPPQGPRPHPTCGRAWGPRRRQAQASSGQRSGDGPPRPPRSSPAGRGRHPGRKGGGSSRSRRLRQGLGRGGLPNGGEAQARAPDARTCARPQDGRARAHTTLAPRPPRRPIRSLVSGAQCGARRPPAALPRPEVTGLQPLPRPEAPGAGGAAGLPSTH